MTTNITSVRVAAAMTDGPMPADWRRGWAVHPFVGRDIVSHWWRRVKPDPHFITDGILHEVYSLCGRVSHETVAVLLLSPGNAKRCLHCARKARLRALT